MFDLKFYLNYFKDPVEVFCRVRPNEDLDAETYIKVNSDTQIQLTPPSVSKAFATGKETQYSFKGKCNYQLIKCQLSLVAMLLSCFVYSCIATLNFSTIFYLVSTTRILYSILVQVI